MSKDSKATKSTTGILLSFTPTGEYYFTKGLKAYQRRDNHKAIKYLERAMQLEPGEPMIACQLAIILSENGKYQEANRLLHMILEEWDEDMVECHYFLANNYAHLGLFKDAYHHASLYMRLEGDGEFAEDAEDLLDLLTLEAEDMEEDFYEHDDLISKQEEARRLLELGDFPNAVKLLKEVIEEFPEYWSAYNNLALAYYYLGQKQQAADLLNEVLEKNHGNLHALCNKAVFAFYEQDWSTVKEIKEILEKIVPMSAEHQFKLGTTFALIGDYELAYSWLKKLYKQGFEGEGPFYYWLSYSAYYTGRMQTAEKSWQKVLQINPEKEGQEPWNKTKSTVQGFESSQRDVERYLAGAHVEERLFGLFLSSFSAKKAEILSSFKAKSPVEKEYLQFLTGEIDTHIAHQTAMALYQFHQPIGRANATLYVMWFLLWAKAEDVHNLKNKKALAAAVEYTWRKLHIEKVSQQFVADQYELSLSTVQKYIKIVNSYKL
ncbi:tetratricopeptide repeat protein [Robertmurraya sp. Marseille-Q9965]